MHDDGGRGEEEKMARGKKKLEMRDRKKNESFVLCRTAKKLCIFWMQCAVAIDDILFINES